MNEYEWLKRERRRKKNHRRLFCFCLQSKIIKYSDRPVQQLSEISWTIWTHSITHCVYRSMHGITCELAFHRCDTWMFQFVQAKISSGRKSNYIFVQMIFIFSLKVRCMLKLTCFQEINVEWTATSRQFSRRLKANKNY